MRQIVERGLWIGNAGDLRDARSILSVGIEAVIEVAVSEQMAALPRDMIRLRFPLSDGGENPLWLLRLAVDSIHALLKANVPTIICCSAGMSRSVCLAAGGLSKIEKRPLDEMLTHVAATGPADVSPRFLLQVREAMSLSSIVSFE